MERLPAGAKRLAVVIVACLALATQVLPWADVLANGGRSRRVLDAYIAAVARGDTFGGTRNGHLTQEGGLSARGVDTQSPAAPVVVGAAKPGFGPRAYPAARANPQNVIMTMVAGNSPARHAVALLQSLRDVGTQADAIVVMLQQGGVGSPECHDKPWMAARNRSGVDCGGSDTVAEEIISPFYVNVLKRLGAVLMVTPELPRTPFTSRISGGSQTFWGMSMNKMQIFNMTQFKKIVFVDADTLMFQNIDHLFGPEYPMFTAAQTHSCCNRNAPTMLSGGFWIVEPSLKWGIRAWELMVRGMPALNGDGSQQTNADGSPKFVTWHLSDLDLARAMFSVRNADALIPLWPFVEDNRHGYVPGLRLLPQYRNVSDAEFEAATRYTRNRPGPQAEGFNASLWDGVTPVWHALDVRYDQCVGNCECLPGRDLREQYISIHFSCIQAPLHKPGWYADEKSFLADPHAFGTECSRYYYVERWYGAFRRAAGRLDPPLWEGPPVLTINATHDVVARANVVRWKNSKG